MFGSSSCVICDYSISDPVCRSCYIRQTKILLNELKLQEIVNEIILRKIKNKFTNESLNDSKCILCRRRDMDICYHCFSEILIRILRELNFTEDSIEEFGFNTRYTENSLERASRSKVEMIF